MTTFICLQYCPGLQLSLARLSFSKECQDEERNKKTILIIDANSGEFSIIPKSENSTYEQSYIENTNVIQTKVTTSDGSFLVTDFAPRFE